MKNNLLLTALLLLVMLRFANAQLTSITTDKANVISGNLKEFVIVDKATQFVIAKEPVKYNATKKMPTCYFTSIPGTESGLTTGSDYRTLAINANLGIEGEHWVITENQDEKRVFISRKKFVTPKYQCMWIPKADGDNVVFLNLMGATNTNWGGYLAIDDAGKFKTVKSFTEASRWKLIYKK